MGAAVILSKPQWTILQCNCVTGLICYCVFHCNCFFCVFSLHMCYCVLHSFVAVLLFCTAVLRANLGNRAPQTALYDRAKPSLYKSKHCICLKWNYQFQIIPGKKDANNLVWISSNNCDENFSI